MILRQTFYVFTTATTPQAMIHMISEAIYISQEPSIKYRLDHNLIRCLLVYTHLAFRTLGWRSGSENILIIFLMRSGPVDLVPDTNHIDILGHVASSNEKRTKMGKHTEWRSPAIKHWHWTDTESNITEDFIILIRIIWLYFANWATFHATLKAVECGKKLPHWYRMLHDRFPSSLCIRVHWSDSAILYEDC